MSLNILVIDDDAVDRMAVKRAMQQIEKGAIFFEAETGKKGLTMIKKYALDCVFLDYLLPDMDGISILHEIQDKDSGLLPCPIIMLTGQGNEKIMMKALSYGAQDYLIKDSISPDALCIALAKAQQVYDLKKDQYTSKQNLTAEVALRTKEHREQSKLFNTIIESLPLTLFVKDVKDDYRWIVWNTEAENTLGLPRQEVLGKNDYDLFKKEEADFFRKTDEDVMRGGTLVEIKEEPITTKKGTLTVNTLKMPIYDAEGKPSILVGILTDITDKKAFTEELKKAKEDAERANHAKDDFLANMSHELRTPMNSILGLTKILLEDDHLNDDQIETLQIIDKSSTSLLLIVNDILDLSKIEAGKVKLENLPFNVTGLMHSLIEQARPLASQQGIAFKNNIDDFPDIHVIGDEFRLSRVILNLISNAIKYTLEGEVSLQIDTRENDNNTIDFICKIKDTGIGIPKDKIEHIFDKFTQAEESTERRFGGTGLGLSITKQLLEIMGGEIHVESTLGEGAVFTILITLDCTDKNYVAVEAAQQAALPDLPSIIRKPIETAHILIAEDHEFNQIFILKLLKRIGCEKIKLVTNGMDAVEAFKADDYDLVLMDCHMPKMNGYDATKAIRTEEEKKEGNSRVPIIAVSADAMDGIHEKCIATGMDEYISKPIDISEFTLLMQNWFVLQDKKSNATGKIQHDNSSGNLAVNLELLKEYANNDLETEKQLIAIFYKKSIKDIQRLESNATIDKHAIWSETAHGLKGSASYVGASTLHGLCDQAQRFEKGSTKERGILLNTIKKEHARVCYYLKEHGMLDEK